MSTDGANIWAFLEVITRRRGLIIGLVLLATIVAAVIAMLLPAWYTATALLLPPPDETVRGGLSDLSEVALYTGGVRFPGMVTPNDVYARMLHSRNVANRVIDSLDLQKYYGAANRSATYLILYQRAKIQVTDEGLLSVAVEDKDPQMASAIATAFVNELIELNREIVSTSARNKREFIEARLKDVTAQLAAARDKLKTFQLDHKTVDLDEQTRLAVEQAIDLKVQQANLELDLRLGEQTLGRDNPELVEKRKHLSAIEAQLRQLEEGGNDSSFFSLPVAQIPGLKGELESLYSTVKVNESLYETLLELFEQARIQEQEQSPTIAVLDWPTPPDLRSRPQRRVIVLGAAAVALVVAVLLALWLEFVARIKVTRPDDYKRLLLFSDAFLGWLPGIRKKAGR